jgi:hypothetical protein
MATFVLSMLDNTALVADSIGTYVWALRWKMKLSHQADPVLGVTSLIGVKAIFSSRRRNSASQARSDASVLFTGTIQDIGKL